MLSVVVTAHARPDRLRACLAALGAQEGEPFELIVVADGAADAVLAVLDGAAATVLRLDPGRGPAAARNAGWRAAAGDLVAFTDDDCVPAPGWTRALVAALDAAPGPAAPGPAAGGLSAAAAGDAAGGRAGARVPGAVVDADVIVQGAVEPIVAERDRIGPFARTLWVRGAGPFFQTANVLYPRALLERLGGFDERFPAPAGEDTDLGWRALEAGARPVFAPDARVEHAVHALGWRGLVADAPRWGSAVRLVRRHPGLRDHFVHRVFWKPAHEALVLALLAALVPGRPGRVLRVAAALRWALVHQGEHPSRASLVRALPAHLAVDAAEVAALARGSLREKTLFL